MKMKQVKPAARRGFTLIELVVTVVIVGLLCAMAVPLGELTLRRVKEHELRTALREIRAAIDAYKAAADANRVAHAADASGYPPSLSVLVDGVTDEKSVARKKLYFLRRLPRDPFGDADSSADATWGKRSYESPPDEPRSGQDVFDVYSQSEETAINGTAYKTW